MLNIDGSLFRPEAVSAVAAARNDKLVEICRHEFDTQQKWYDVGAAEYRKRRDAGETVFPKPVTLSRARIVDVPSRDEGRLIRVRCFVPDGIFRGIYLHIHGGGWVLSNAASQDTHLSSIAQASGMIAASIEYRLAPEHPSPAPENDCFDVAHYFLSPASIAVLPIPADVKKRIVVAGESAGAHLAITTVLALRAQHMQSVAGMVLNYGIFDLSLTPSARASTVPLVLCAADLDAYIKAYLPTKWQSRDDLQRPEHSPLYADLMGLCPALLTCGTLDCLLDDTVLLALRYMAAGNDTQVKLFPGAPHGFATMMNEQSEALEDEIVAYLRGI